MSLLNFIWKCKSIGTPLALIGKYPLHFSVFISSLPSLQFYWAIWPFLAKRYFFGGRSYKFIRTGYLRTNVLLHPHLFHVLFLCIALSKRSFSYGFVSLQILGWAHCLATCLGLFRAEKEAWLELLRDQVFVTLLTQELIFSHWHPT